MEGGEAARLLANSINNMTVSFFGRQVVICQPLFIQPWVSSSLLIRTRAGLLLPIFFRPRGHTAAAPTGSGIEGPKFKYTPEGIQKVPWACPVYPASAV